MYQFGADRDVSNGSTDTPKEATPRTTETLEYVSYHILIDPVYSESSRAFINWVEEGEIEDKYSFLNMLTPHEYYNLS